MEYDKPFILWLENVDSTKHDLAGGKAVGLGENIKAGIPVPPGFVVTSEAYRSFILETELTQRIQSILKEEIKSGLPDEYERASARIRSLIMRSTIPPSIVAAVKQAYRKLGKIIGIDNPRVAVRSSATVEDLPEASFAGQQETYLNVQGEEEVMEHVKMAWASLWTARVLSYRDSLNIEHESALMAVVVEKMVNSRTSGVMFTIHPVSGDPSQIVIESIWGLGEYIVEGKVTPDEFVLDKDTLETIEERISTEKRIGLFYDPDSRSNVEVKIPSTPEELEALKKRYPKIAKTIEELDIKPDEPSLKEDEIKQLGELGLRIEEVFGRHMDVEWAIDFEMKENNLFILQARPETYWSRRRKEPVEEEEIEPGAAEVLVRGIPASPGIAIGKVKVAFKADDASKLMEKGDILVTRMTDPDWVPYMKIAGAIVTDEGGMTAHAAIVSRELGIPAIVGSGNATEALKTGMLVTVDGTQGVVYKGKVKARKEVRPGVEHGVEVTGTLSPEVMREIYPITATKIYMNLGQPQEIDRYLHLPFDGIGLMRIEFIISDWIGYHPIYLIDQGRGVYFVDKLAEGIAKVARPLYPRPVVVRFSDFKSNEYRKLKGGEKYEPEDERNPMLGWRGVSRYASKEYEPAFRLEVRAIKKVRDEWGLKNVWVMFPFVRNTWELRKALKIMEDEGLERRHDFKVWIMSEVPSTVILAEDFSRMVDGFSVGSNDLTQLILGVDRDSGRLFKMGYFDERDPAVMKAIEALTNIAHKYGRTVSICGQAPSVYPEVVEYLVRIGVDSISVNPDAVVRVRRHVASLEKKMVLDLLRGKA
ncbi:MAG: pyruvate, water dikinase [Desulfurococcales archaeon]|nr:pyruvate, water dikinase [Desulfurococcales archaeon]